MTLIIRPFSQLDRVDRAREVFRLARQGLNGAEISAELKADPQVVYRLAREEGITVPPPSQKSDWPTKDDPGIATVNHRDVWDWNENDRRSYHWSRMTRGARAVVGSLDKMADTPRQPAGRRAVCYGAPINLIAPHFAKTIVVLVGLKHRVSVEEITGPRRDRRIVAIRNEAIRLVHSHCPHLSLPAMGRLFGDRDHTTILHSLRATRRFQSQAQSSLTPARSNGPQERGLTEQSSEHFRANQPTM